MSDQSPAGKLAFSVRVRRGDWQMPGQKAGEHSKEKTVGDCRRQSLSNIPPEAHLWQRAPVSLRTPPSSSTNSGEGTGTPLQCSCLENPRDGGAWWAAVHGVAKSRTRLKRLSSSSSSVHELTVPVRHLQAVLLKQSKIDLMEFTQGTCADPAYTGSGFLGNHMYTCISTHQLRKQMNLASHISSFSQQSRRKWGSACPSKKKKKKNSQTQRHCKLTVAGGRVGVRNS